MFDVKQHISLQLADDAAARCLLRLTGGISSPPWLPSTRSLFDLGFKISLINLKALQAPGYVTDTTTPVSL